MKVTVMNPDSVSKILSVFHPQAIANVQCKICISYSTPSVFNESYPFGAGIIFLILAHPLYKM